MTKPNLTLVHGEGNSSAPATTETIGDKLRRFGVSLMPLAPIRFSGTDTPYAFGRLLVYGTLAYFTWSKYRKLSYIAMGAGGVSLVSSLMADVWAKNNGSANSTLP